MALRLPSRMADVSGSGGEFFADAEGSTDASCSMARARWVSRRPLESRRMRRCSSLLNKQVNSASSASERSASCWGRGSLSRQGSPLLPADGFAFSVGEEVRRRRRSGWHSYIVGPHLLPCNLAGNGQARLFAGPGDGSPRRRTPWPLVRPRGARLR